MKLNFNELSILLNVISAMVSDSDLTVPACMDEEGRKVIKAQLKYEGIGDVRALDIATNLKPDDLISHFIG